MTQSVKLDVQIVGYRTIYTAFLTPKRRKG